MSKRAEYNFFFPSVFILVCVVSHVDPFNIDTPLCKFFIVYVDVLLLYLYIYFYVTIMCTHLSIYVYNISCYYSTIIANDNSKSVQVFVQVQGWL